MIGMVSWKMDFTTWIQIREVEKKSQFLVLTHKTSLD